MFLASILLALALSTSAAPSTSDNNPFEPFDLYPENNGGRIVGGHETSIEEVNYIGALLRNGHHNCGVCIISEGYTLTAAHCVSSSTPASLGVRVGSSFRTARPGDIVVGVMRIIMHPRYNQATIDYDYAILKLTTKLQLKSTVQPISLPRISEKIADGEGVWTSGWGSTHNANQSNEILRTVKIEIINREKCRSAYASRIPVTERMICAGDYYNGGRDACQG